MSNCNGNFHLHIFRFKLGDKLTFRQLMDKARNDRAIRCGLSKDPQNRKNGYSHEGYNGTMYYASTEDMKRDEQKLLDLKIWRGNKQNESNGHHEPGFVYIIYE